LRCCLYRARRGTCRRGQRPANHSAGNDRQAEAYRQGREARTQLIADMLSEEQRADDGAPPASNFLTVADRLARLMTKDKHIRLAFAALGGWDTHIDQGSDTGQLAGHLKPLGDALAVFAKGLGPDWNDTVVVVISEFGGTVRENGNRGTNHGHGNVIWLTGGKVNGGKVYGDWPGLADAQLYQNRDLAITTDYRHVLASCTRAASAPARRGDDQNLPGNAGDARQFGADFKRRI
jgi:uncharacterized protein (DUF1501 family)